MSTTDILFNSPALHSLKRAQLVQLCKRHNIKASGKNTDLVARLKEHARGLPSDTPLSVAVRSETEPDNSFGEGDGDSGEGDGNDKSGMMTDISDEDNVEDQLNSPTSPGKVRDSQVWEIVSRGSIESKRSVATAATRSHAGNFSSATNSKTTILRSIVSSIGLARSPSNNSIPAGESSDSLAPNGNKKDKDLSSSPKPRSIFSSLMPRSRSNSHESQTKAKDDARKSLIANAIPYNDIPMPSVSRRPQVEPFAFSYTGPEDTSLVSDVSMASLDRPVPGVGSFFSVNANDGVGTVRLITSTNKPPGNEEEGPKLKPVVPSFDLIPPTPGKTGLHRFPFSDTPQTNRTTLYPTITADDMSIDLVSLASPSKKPSKESMVVDKSLPDVPERSPISPTSPKEPFIFGSPNPRHSTTPADFTNAASSVLAEMNARLGAAGGRGLDANVLAHTSGARSKLDVDALLKYEFGGSSKNDGDDGKGGKKEDSVSKKFDKLHEKAFSKMDGIDTHYAAKRVLRDKEKDKEKLEPLPGNRKRKQSVLKTRKSTALAQSKKTKATNKAVQKKTSPVKIPGAFEDEMDVDESMTRTEVDEEREGEHVVDEENDRGAKRACVAEPAADGTGETRRISIAPRVRKDISDDEEEEMDEEKKRKQSEAIKRKLELNKARRRSSRGRVSMAARSPQKQKGFLASAKSFVKSVWNRGANPTVVKNNSSGPSYLRATASSTSKAHEQETKASVPAMGSKPTVSRASSVRSSKVGTGVMSRKPSTSKPPQRQHQTQETVMDIAPASGLEAVAEAEGDGEKVAPGAPAPLPQTDTTQKAQASAPAPIFGSVKARKPSTAASLARNPSRSRAFTTTVNNTVAGRASRLLAPTASSLAKVNASPTKGNTSAGSAGANALRAKVPSVRARGTVMSPSRIPVFSPPQRKNQNQGTVPGSAAKRIFGSPLLLPSSPQARSAAEKGQDVNPITGAVSPQHQRIPFSSANGQTQSLIGAAAAIKKEVSASTITDRGKGKEVNAQNESPTKVNKALNSLRKPRISRTKIISRLGTRTAAPAVVSRAPNSPTKPVSTTASGVTSSSKAPATPKVRSSTGVAVRHSLGGAKARENNGNAVILSAKKRARATEYARRKSAKSPIRKLDFSQACRSGEAMEVDD